MIRRGWLLAAALFTIAGCGPRSPRQMNQVAPKSSAQQSTDRQATGRGIQIRWHEKTRNGGIARVVDVDAETGDLNPRDESGRLNNATGLLYRDNLPRARFRAPVVSANREKETVTASGGVTITSISPQGITVWADQITWIAPENTILAERNVRFLQVDPKSGKVLARGGAPRVTINTELQRFTIP